MDAKLLLFCGLLVSYTVAQSQNPECQDLVNLKKKAETAIKPYGTMSCTPNKNCSGLACNGTIKGRSFRGTVILQACHKPVTLLVHVGQKRFVVKDGQKISVVPALKIYAFPEIRKEDNVVYVTLTLKTCVFVNHCVELAKLLNNQPIRVQCNGSSTKPTSATLSPSKKKPNLECKSLNSMKNVVEHNFAQYAIFSPGSKITCNPDKKCSGLQCSGIYGNQKFTASTTLDYCSSPVTLKLQINVPDKDVHFSHTFKDGEKYKVSNMPLYVTVHLKRNDNNITVTVTGELGGVKKDLVKDMNITVDPSHCPPKCPSLQPLKNAMEKFTMPRNSSKKTSIRCTTIEQCTSLRCIGVFNGVNFTSVSTMKHCTPPVSFHVAIFTRGRCYMHLFKDSDTFKMPLPISIGLKRMKNDVLVNITVRRNIPLVRNVPITVDPSRCPAVHRSTGHGNKLSGATIAGIVVGTIIVVVLLVACGVWMRKTKRVILKPSFYNHLAMSDDTDPLYDDFEPAVA